jgi:hypothetical protein
VPPGPIVGSRKARAAQTEKLAAGPTGLPDVQDLDVAALHPEPLPPVAPKPVAAKQTPGAGVAPAGDAPRRNAPARNSTVRTASASESRALQPRRSGQQPAPYAQTDFTAYTLELGETRVGLGSVAVGVMPRVQIGTQAALDLVGALNANVKADLLRFGAMDIAVQGNVVSYNGDEMTARYLRGGLGSSLRVSKGLSLHAAASFASLYAGGTPNLTPLATPFSWIAGWRPTEDTIEDTESRLEFEGTAEVATARFAADVRFNRRDSIVLQWQSMVWGESSFPVEIPAAVTGGDPVAPESSGWLGMTDAYVASVSYQASLRNFDLRVGVGASSLPGAWFLQSTELAWRFGGPTRRAETREARALREQMAQVAPPAPPLGAAAAR